VELKFLSTLRKRKRVDDRDDIPSETGLKRGMKEKGQKGQKKKEKGNALVEPSTDRVST
jgi:hypothetical protein